MTALMTKPITAEAYLEIERNAQIKSELFEGHMQSRPSGTYRHSRVKVRLITQISNALRGKPCRPTDSDMRVHIPELGNFTYPDLSIVCGKPEFLDAKQDTLTNPTVLFEVLSESTAAFDRGKKFFYYRHLSSLQDYLLVSQDEPLIEHYSRQPNGGWLFTTVEAGQILHLASLDCSIAVDEIYHDIDPT
jgi:Uma2 family endonuclease